MRTTLAIFAVGAVASASAFAPGATLPGTLTARKASAVGPVMADQVNCGINGFGRIGRLVARIMVKDPETKLLHVNAGSATPDYMAYQFKYDSIHGRFDGSVVVDGDDLVLDGQRIITTRAREPKDIGWDKTGVEYLCESTGVFLTEEKAKAHVDGGVKKVIFSAPAKDDSLTVVMGVNQEEYKGQTDYVSCASCTTNGLAPLVKCINDKFEIEEGLMTTIHAMTATQAVVDSSSRKDWRGGRAASGNIIPSSTGAAKAVAKVIPAVKGKLTGMAFRVPTIDVSVVDLTCRLKKGASYEEICAEVKRRSEGDMKGFLGYCDEPLVSTDFESHPISSTFDAEAGISLNPNFVKLVAWYDNEWGYSTRVKDLMVHMAKVDAKAAK
jgi:glyceraldehyde 3-phosphate dehydrogenase